MFYASRKPKFDLANVVRSMFPAGLARARRAFSQYRAKLKIGVFLLSLALVFSSPNSTQAQVTADLDGSGIVNLLDLKILVGYWLDTNCAVSNNCEGADFEPDGDVDFVDYAAFSNQLYLVEGDFDGNSVVNWLDLKILVGYWLETNCASLDNCQGADFEPDGDVDFVDYGVFSNRFGIGSAPITTSRIEVEATFLSIGSEDGIVWDENGGGVGVSSRTDKGDGSENEALRLGDYQESTDPNYGYRTILSFDTSSLPYDAVIVSARLEMTRGTQVGTDPFGWGGSCKIDIASPHLGPTSAVEPNDWQATATATNVASFSYLADPGGETLMVSDDFNTPGLAGININGKTQLRVYFTVSNNGSGTDYLGFYSGDSPTITKQPRLVISYTTRTPTFYSIGSEDGIVWDENGGGVGVDGRTDKGLDDENEALRLGDYVGPYGYRTILSFDTNSLPDDAVIVSARLEMTRGTKVGTDPFGWMGNSCDIDIDNPFSNSFDLENSDWEDAATATNVASFLADPGADQPMVSQDFDTNGLQHINKTGKTQLRVYFTTSDNGGGSDYLGFYAGEYEEIQQKRPKLIISYE